MLLLCWIAFIPDALPGSIMNSFHWPNLTHLYVTASLSILAIVPLVVSLFRGSATQRVTSAIALIFPTLVFLKLFHMGIYEVSI